jgi:hypothetical protein
MASYSHLPASLLPSSPSPAPLLQLYPSPANPLSSTLLLLLLLLLLPTIHSCRTSWITGVSQGVSWVTTSSTTSCWRTRGMSRRRWRLLLHCLECPNCPDCLTVSTGHTWPFSLQMYLEGGEAVTQSNETALM